jgi:hypothetical protein
LVTPQSADANQPAQDRRSWPLQLVIERPVDLSPTPKTR